MRTPDISPLAGHAQMSSFGMLQNSGEENEQNLETGLTGPEKQRVLSRNIFRVLNDKTIPSNVRKILRSAIVSFRTDPYWKPFEIFKTAGGYRHYIRIDTVTLFILEQKDAWILEDVFAGSLEDGTEKDPNPGATLPGRARRQLSTPKMQRQGKRKYLSGGCRALILVLGAISFFIWSNAKSAIAATRIPSATGLLYNPISMTTKQLYRY
jgi:hypothetical protein